MYCASTLQTLIYCKYCTMLNARGHVVCRSVAVAELFVRLLFCSLYSTGTRVFKDDCAFHRLCDRVDLMHSTQACTLSYTVYALAGGRGLGARIADVDVNVVRADPIALLIGTRIGDHVAFSSLLLSLLFSSVLFYSILVPSCMV